MAMTMVALATMVLVLSASQAKSQTDIVTAKPGQVLETAAPAETVVETVHYQAVLELDCFGSACAGDFLKPGANRRLNITRVACRLAGATNVVATFGQVILKGVNGSYYFYQAVPIDRSVVTSTLSHHILNQAIDIQVPSNRRLEVRLFAEGNPMNASCIVTGTRDTLQ